MRPAQSNSPPRRLVLNDIVKPRLLGSDQMFWWLIDQNHPVHVTLVAEVAGPTTVDGWRAALDEIQRCHPNLFPARLAGTTMPNCGFTTSRARRSLCASSKATQQPGTRNSQGR